MLIRKVDVNYITRILFKLVKERHIHDNKLIEALQFRCSFRENKKNQNVRREWDDLKMLKITIILKWRRSFTHLVLYQLLTTRGQGRTKHVEWERLFSVHGFPSQYWVLQYEHEICYRSSAVNSKELFELRNGLFLFCKWIIIKAK